MPPAESNIISKNKHSRNCKVAWVVGGQARCGSPSSGMAKTIDYSLKRWAAILIRYASSSVCQSNNNPIENAIRPSVLGSKNWLFAGLELARPAGGRDSEQTPFHSC